MVSHPATTPDPTRAAVSPSTANCPFPTPPPLSPRESELLSAFMILRYDMVALAEQQQLNPPQLLAFINSPAVQSNLAALKAFADLAFSIRSLETRTLALNHLEAAANAAPNPIEKRRAASALLRGLHIPVARTSKPPTTRDLDRPERKAWTSVSDAPGNSEPESPRNAPRLPPKLRAKPHYTPSPDLPPERVARYAAEALASHDCPGYVATLDALLAPDATFEGQPITDIPNLYNSCIRKAWVRECQDRGNGSDTVRHFHIIYADELPLSLTLTRSPNGPAPNCWLVSEIHRDSS